MNEQLQIWLVGSAACMNFKSCIDSTQKETGPTKTQGDHIALSVTAYKFVTECMAEYLLQATIIHTIGHAVTDAYIAAIQQSFMYKKNASAIVYNIQRTKQFIPNASMGRVFTAVIQK